MLSLLNHFPIALTTANKFVLNDTKCVFPPAVDGCAMVREAGPDPGEDVPGGHHQKGGEEAPTSLPTQRYIGLFLYIHSYTLYKSRVKGKTG